MERAPFCPFILSNSPPRAYWTRPPITMITYLYSSAIPNQAFISSVRRNIYSHLMNPLFILFIRSRFFHFTLSIVTSHLHISHSALFIGSLKQCILFSFPPHRHHLNIMTTGWDPAINISYLLFKFLLLSHHDSPLGGRRR